LHIASIRSAYAGEEGGKGQGLPLLSTESNRIALRLDDEGRPVDHHAPMAPRLTAATAEQRLARILATISREQIRYVGIVATDVRDKIFLACMIRDFCPDVQVVTTNGNLLLAHPTFSAHTRGMVVASSYPLYSKNQQWAYRPKGDQRQFLFTYQ